MERIHLLILICLCVVKANTQDLAQVALTRTAWAATWDGTTTKRPVGSKQRLDAATKALSAASESGDIEAHAVALLQLGNIQHSVGDIENAVRNSMRAASLAQNGPQNIRRQAILQLTSIHLDAGHADRAVELLQELGAVPAHEKAERRQFLRLDSEAKSRTLPPDQLIIHLNGAVAEAVKTSDDALQAELLSLMATACTRTGATARAVELEERVMLIALKLGYSTQAGISANNLAELLRGTPRAGETTELYQRALILLDDRPDLKLGAMLNSAVQQALSADIMLAYRTLDEARQVALGTQDPLDLAIVERTRAALQFKEGDLNSAAVSAESSLHSAMEAKSEVDQMRACDLLASITERQGNITAARGYQKASREHQARSRAQEEQTQREHAADLARWQRMEREQMEQTNRQQRQQSEMRQLALDAENQEKRMALLMAEKQLEEGARREESLARTRAQQDLALTRAALDAERSERMIQDLENTRLLQSMSMDRLSMERKQREADVERLQRENEMSEAKSRTLEAEQSTQRTMRNSSIAVAALMLVFGGYMTWAWYVARKKKRTIWRQKKQIEGINEELAEKNHDIESSLRYARTIQSAIVPAEDDLRSILPESFMVYRPLGAVSGDLPYFQRVGNRLYIAAVDCTGHGVPAAMMTFIAYYGLNELISAAHTKSCGTILDELHMHIKKTLSGRQDMSGYQDGCDIGLCAMDLRTGEVNFAGAQLPLLVQRASKIDRIKGDVLPLGDGQFEHTKGYQDHHASLRPGDRLFLFSDGIMHQFGGAEGKQKFSLKRLQATLEATADAPLETTREQTIAALDQWKGTTPQTDDILIMGLRFAA